MTEKCNHEKLYFGSGDWFVICTNCHQFWAKEVLEGHERRFNNDICGEFRIKEVKIDD